MQVTVKAITPCKTGSFMITFSRVEIVEGVGEVDGPKLYLYINRTNCQVNDKVTLDMSKFDVVDKQGKNSEGVECTFKVLELKF